MTEFNLTAIAASVGVLGLAIAASLSVYRDVIVRMLSASIFSQLDGRRTERILFALIFSLLFIALASIGAAVTVQVWPEETVDPTTTEVASTPIDPADLSRPEGILSAAQMHEVANSRCLLFTYDRATISPLPNGIASRMLDNLVNDTQTATYRRITVLGQMHARLDRQVSADYALRFMDRRATTAVEYLVDRFDYPRSLISTNTAHPRDDTQEFGPYICGARIILN